MRVGQPSGSPDPSAALDVSSGPYSSGSQYRGIAPPKVALTQTSLAAPITNPATGLLVYNIAKAGDVTPGYYYWDGSQWARFSTNSKSGSARVATAGGGQSIKAFLLADLSTSAFTSAYPDNFILVDRGREGLFSLDATDITTPDNGGTVLVRGGKCYKRKFSGPIDVRWYGNLVEGGTNDITTMLQAAVDDAVKVASPGSNGPFKNYSGNPGTVLIPAGDFEIRAAININGSIRIKGQSGGTYAGSRLVQKTDGISIFLLGGDTDGAANGDGTNNPNNGSNSTVIEDLMFQSGSATSNFNVAQIKARPGIASNSVYIRNCWFQGAEYSAIWLPQGDDIQITGCTFDVLAFDAIRLGDNVSGGIVQNCRITNNTFFEVRQNTIKIQKAKAVIIANNSAYYVGSAPWGNSVFFNTQDATLSQGIVVNANTVELLTAFSILEAGAVNDISISNNTVSRIKGSFITFTSANTATNLKVTNNTISSLDTWTAPPLNFHYSGLTNSIITNNTIINTVANTTLLAVDAPNSQVTGNIFRENIFTGFASKPNNFASELDNGITYPDRYIQGASAISRATYIGSGNFQTGNYASGMYAISPSVTGMPQNGGTWSVIVSHNEDGSGSGGGPYWTCTATRVDAPSVIYTGGVNNGVWQGWSGVFVTPSPSAPISTAGWTAGTYYEIKAPGTLAANTIYVLKLAFSKQGTDEIVASYLVPMISTYSGSGSVTITGNTASHSNVGRTFTVRLKAGTNLRGIEVSPSHNDMAGGTLTVTIASLL